MSNFLIIAAAGATFLAGPQTVLQPNDIVGHGIQLSVLDLERDFGHPYPLFRFEIGLDDFIECDPKSGNIGVFDEQGQLVFGTSIAQEFGSYSFSILEQYLSAAVFTFTCEAGPDELDPSYTIELWDYRRAP